MDFNNNIWLQIFTTFQIMLSLSLQHFSKDLRNISNQMRVTNLISSELSVNANAFNQISSLPMEILRTQCSRFSPDNQNKNWLH